jgi:hypothetical protein
MAFFTPKDGFTHHARFYGFPCYYRSDGPDGCDLAGTNVVFDWLILHVAPQLHRLCEFIRYVVNPADYEPGPWPIELRGEIEQNDPA